MSPTPIFPKLLPRLATALIGGGVILASVVLGAWSYFAVFLLICFLTQREFYKLAGMDGHLPLRAFGVFCGLVTYSLAFLIERHYLPFAYYLLIFPLASIVYIIKLYRGFERKPFTNIAFTFLGICYVALPFALLHLAAFETGAYNYQVIVGMLVILWVSDSSAYFGGTRFGRSKLFERISPKKTWEGFVAGAVAGLITSYVISRYFHSLSLVDWMVVGTIIIVGGTFGDLVESLLKRSMEIKDSGNSLPGHGGFLDRFDGLLISIPFIVAYLEIF